jgi:hypothetical protein
VITENQLDFIRKKINEIDHGKITIAIQDGGAKLDIITERRERVLREEGGRQAEPAGAGPPCTVRRLRPSMRASSRQDEEYLTRTARRV